MGKIKYLVKRISRMNYKEMLNTVKEVHTKTKKNSIFIFFDIVYCGLRYQAGHIDYKLFEMYKMNAKERKTIITRGINNEILKKYNDLSKSYIFEDKALFNKMYNKFIKRDWLFLSDNNYHDYENFIKNKENIIVKPLSLSCGKGVEKIKISDYNKKDLYNYLLKNNKVLLEEVAEQNQKISEIFPYSVNTVRVVTLNKKVVAAFIRFGNGQNVVDNFNHGGMVTTINIKTGIVEYPAIDKSGNIYESHPVTNKMIIGLKIPMWEKIKKLCIEACDITPEIGYIGWDVCVGKKDVSLIEGNDFPGHDLYQLPVHRNDNIGLLPTFRKAMED